MKLKKDYFIAIMSQALSYIVPFFIIVHISHIYSKELVVLFFSQSLVQNFISITDYGYAVKGSRLFAIENDKQKLSEIASSIYSTKITLLIISLIILFAILCISDFARENFLFIMIYIGVLLSNILFPGWAFIGKKRFSFIYFNTIVSYSLLLFLTLMIAKKTTPFIFISAIYSLSFLIPAFVGFFVLKKELNFKISFQLKSIYTELKDGFEVFLSTSIKGFYISLPMTMLGIISDQQLLYNFSYPDKFVKLFVSFFNFIMRLTLPFFTRNNQEIKKYFLPISPLFLSIPIFLIIFKKSILLVVFNIKNIDFTYELLVTSMFFKFTYIYIAYYFFFAREKEASLWKIFAVGVILLSILILICSKLNISVGYSVLVSDAVILVLMLKLIKNSKTKVEVKI